MNNGNIPPPPPLPFRGPLPPHPLKHDEFNSELPYLRLPVLPPPPPPPFPRPPSAGPHVNGAPRSPNDVPPPVPARPLALRRPKTSSGEQNPRIPPPPPRIAHEAHPHLDIAIPTNYVRQRVLSRALPQPAGAPNSHAPAIPSKGPDGWNPPSYGGMAQHFVGANLRIPVESEAAVRMKEEILAQQRAIEDDRRRMQAIAAEERRLEEETRERKRRQEEEEARLAHEREAERREAERREAERREAERIRLEEETERIRKEVEAERIRKEAEAERRRLEREAEAQRKAEEAERKRLEEERREQWEREERERKERWERDEAERIRWLLNEKQRMDDERLAQMEAMREEMRMEFQKQKAELEAAAAAAQLEAEEAARKRERELQEQGDAELAKRIAEETQDQEPPPTPAPAPPRQAVDGGPVQANASLPTYEELDSGRLSPPAPAPIRHSPSPRSRVLPLPPTPPIFPSPQPLYHDPFQPPPMGYPSRPGSSDGARTPLQRSPIRQPIELPPENPVFRTVSPPMNGHVHGSESFDHTQIQHRPPVSNGLNRNAVSLGGANPGVGRAPPQRFGGFNHHQPRTSPPLPAHLTSEEGLPVGARPGATRPVSSIVPNTSNVSAVPSQSLYPSAVQAPGSGPGLASGSGSGSGSATGSGSGSGAWSAHYGDPPPDRVSGILFGYGRPVIQVLPLPAPRAIDPVLVLDPSPGKPFHVVAHSWRHLLRFLAGCFNTRVEPSPAAMAREKTSPRLRVVLHFVRLPAGDWRIVLYFALDSAEKAPDGYPSWNTTVLPYNFPAPEPGKPMVHTDETPIYTITTQPLPILPLALPNLERYLQASLDESRHANGSDSRSRLRALVQACENNKPVAQFERPGLLSVIGMSGSGSSSSGGSGSGPPPVNNTQVEIGGPTRLSKRKDDTSRPGFFSKLLGKNKNQGGVNDEAYDRITPFNAGEYPTFP